MSQQPDDHKFPLKSFVSGFVFGAALVLIGWLII